MIPAPAVNSAADSVVETALPFLDGAPYEPSPDRPFTVVFAVQPSVPGTRKDRTYLLRRALDKRGLSLGHHHAHDEREHGHHHHDHHGHHHSHDHHHEHDHADAAPTRRSLVLLGFVLMLVRSIQIAVENWRRGYSILERPGAFDGTEG